MTDSRRSVVVLSKVSKVEDKTEKLADERGSDNGAQESRDDAQSRNLPEPVAGNPAEDATPLADADPTGLDRQTGERHENLVDTSGDIAAAREALDEARDVLADQTDTQHAPADVPSVDAGQLDDAETAASDDTVTEDALHAPVEQAEEIDEFAEDDEVEEVVAVPAGPVELDIPDEEEIKLQWYILKVQSNRERSIAENLRRKIAIEGLDNYFGQVLVPTEKVTEFKGGKKKIVERKLWPGYIAVEMHVNDDTWFAIRETAGIGDFTGSAGTPTPMQPHEVAKILHQDEEETAEAPKLDIKFSPGDKVKVKEGNFENFEGEVSSIDETHGRVTVMLSIFGRPTPVELEYWQVESL